MANSVGWGDPVEVDNESWGDPQEWGELVEVSNNSSVEETALNGLDLQPEKEKDGILSSIGKTAYVTPERLLGAAGGIMESYGRNNADDFSDRPQPPRFNALPGIANRTLAVPRYASELIKYYADTSSYGLGKLGAIVTPDETKQELIRSGQALSSEAEHTIKEEGANPAGKYSRFATDVTAGITDLGASILVGIATKSPKLAASVMGGQVYGHKYNEYQTKLTAPVDKGGKGLDREAADKLARGAAQFAAIAEGLTETIPAAAILKKGGKYAKKLLNAGVTEGIQESVMAAIEQTYDAIELKDMTLVDAIIGIDWVKVGYNGLVGAAVGSSLASVTPNGPDKDQPAVDGENGVDSGALNAEDTLGPDDTVQPVDNSRNGLDINQAQDLNQQIIDEEWGEPAEVVNHGQQQAENGLQLNPEQAQASENQKVIDSVPMGDITPTEVSVGWNDGVEVEKKYLSDFKKKPASTASNRARQNRSIDWGNDDLATVIRKMGGINTEKDSDWFGRLSQLNKGNNTFGLPGIEQKGDKGLTVEQLTEALAQDDILALKDEYGNYDNQLMQDYLFKLESGEKVWLNTTDPKNLVEQQSREDAVAEESALENQRLDGERADESEARVNEILNNAEDFNAIASEYFGETADHFNARSMEELIREGNNIDPEAVERITDSSKEDSAVAVELINLINQGNQNGLSIAPTPEKSETGNEPAGVQAPAEPESDIGSETGSAKNGVSGTGQAEANGVKIPDQKKPDKSTYDAGTVKAGKFTATHELADGTRVIATDEDNVWQDKAGDEYEENGVSKITKPVDKPSRADQEPTNGIISPDKLPDLANGIDVAAHQAATSPLNTKDQPTDKEKEAGDYDKGRFTFEGIDAEIDSLSQELADLFKAESGKLNSGVNPKILEVGAKLGALYIAKGAVTFAQYSRAIINKLKKHGVDAKQIKPALKGMYLATQANVDDELFEQMDDPRKVRLYNLDHLDQVEKTEPEAAKDFPDAYYHALLDGNAPKNNLDLRKFLRVLDNKEATQARMKEAQEGIELAMVRYARDVVKKGNSVEDTYNELVELYNNQPLLNIRTSTSVANQAYSTPAPIAYLASELSRVTNKSVLWEPTAGNGMLTIGASLKNVKANELNNDRIVNLKALGLKPTQGDALTAIKDGIIKAKSADAVVTNPPFGGLKEKADKDGYKITKIDHLIAAEALEAMKDDGRATLIIGANKVAKTMAETDRIFFNWLYSHYNVSDNFEIDGKLYNRQGAGWPIRVITIAGRSASNKLSPAASSIDRVGNWDELFTRYEESIKHSDEVVVSTDSETGTTGVNGSEDTGNGTNNGNTVPGSNGNANTRSPGERGGSNNTGSASNTGTKRPGSTGTRNTGKPDNSDGLGNVPTEQNQLEQGGRQPGKKPVPTDAASGKSRPDGHSKLDESIGSGFQVEYKAKSKAGAVDVLVPVNMSTPMEKALQVIDDAVGGIDNYVREKLGYKSDKEMNEALMGLQIDSVAAAIYNIENGEGIIIADQTGIGKGRQAAAILRYARKEGKIPVFVTVKADLFTDMYGDAQDIGVNDASPLLMNADASITDRVRDVSLFKNKAAQHVRTLDGIVESGELPSGKDMLFLTYSQINKAGNKQQQVLRSIAPNAIFVLDESHNAGGSSNTGIFMQSVLEESKGVTYLSATYAKRPDNLPLYLKTSISKAVDGLSELVDAVTSGGLGLQTVVSNMLTEAGQLFRRERSFNGIEIETKTDTINKKKHTRLADRVTDKLRLITQADEAFHSLQVAFMDKQAKKDGKRIVGAGNKSEAGVDHSKFSSVAHNAIRQFVLALKAETTAVEAIAAIKRGEKPVIALENTMGSFLKDYQKDMGVEVGEDLSDFDYRSVLSRALARSRRVTIKDERGGSRTVDIPLNELAPPIRRLFDDAQNAIDSMDVAEIPVSPIDWIRHRINEAGYTVKEITGRELMVDYSNGQSVLIKKEKDELDRVKTRDEFNNGGLDAMILNVAGSTGISLHASEKFKDQRLRHMIVTQPALDINVFMQMLGRVHRTGQVRVPKYSILNLDIPAEIRPTSVLSKKMKSLNANTSSNTDSDTSVETLDIINKYGDMVVEQYFSENMEVAFALNLSSGDISMPDIAMKATGRMALLPVKDQVKFYNEIEPEYRALIEFLDSTGQNELEIKTIPLDAKEIEITELSAAKDESNVFGQSSNLVKYDVKKQGKPMVYTEINKHIEEELNGETKEVYAESILREMNTIALEQIAKKNQSVTDLNKELSENNGSLDEKEVAAIRKSIDSHLGAISRLEMDRADMTSKLGNYMQIGNMARLRIADQVYTGVVGAVTFKHKGGSPYSKSKTKVTFYVNDAARTLRIPLSKLWNGDPAIYEGQQRLLSLEEVFSAEAASNSREERYIVTGNLLSAYSELKTAGQVISFHDHDGDVKQGILMPHSFDAETSVRQDVSMREPSAVINFLRDFSSDKEISREGVASRDGVIRVIADGRGVRIQVPKAKARGGKWYLDESLTSITGDFITERGSSLMSVDVRGDTAVDALRYIMSKTGLYAPQSYTDKARPYVGEGTNAQRRPEGRFNRKPEREASSSGFGIKGIEKFTQNFIMNLIQFKPIKHTIFKTPEEFATALNIDPADAQDSLGYIKGNHVYIIASNINSSTELHSTLRHELFAHYGLDIIDPAIKAEILAKVKQSQFMPGMREIWKEVNKTYKGDSLNDRAEEVIARIAETPNRKIPIWEQIRELIIKALRGIGFITNTMTRKETEALIETLADGIRTGKPNSNQLRAMVAWHGGPHDFDKFSTDKIGTGEGAQVYGWGIYFASKKEVGEFYRKNLSGGKAGEEIYYKNKKIGSFMDLGTMSNEQKAAAYISAYPDNAKEMLRYDNFISAIEWVDKINHSDAEVRKAGKLYQVELAPKENEYLRHDDTFDRQPEGVRQAVAKATGKSAEYIDGLEMDGSQVYNMLTRMVSENSPQSRRAFKAINVDPYSAAANEINNDELASRYLHSLGVRGIRFIDGSSRFSDGGSFNYVIFNDSDISITEKFNLRPDADSKPMAVRVDKRIIAERRVNKMFDDVAANDRRKKPRRKDMAIRPKLMANRRPAAGQSPGEKSIVRKILDAQPVDKIFRAPFTLLIDDHGKFKPGVKAEEKLEHLIKNSKTGIDFIDRGLETVRHGVIDRYQTPQEFIDREQESIREQRKHEAKAIEFIKDLAEQIQDPKEWKLVKAMLEGEDVGINSWNNLAVPVRRAIDEMGRDAVDLGLITAETYEKNKGSYLHRVYKKHEAATTGIGKITQNIGSSVKKKIQGSALKRRGMSFKIEQERLLRDTPVDWFGIKKHLKFPDKRLVKQKFVLLERYNDAGEKNNQLDVGEGSKLRKLKHRVWLPAGEVIPGKYAEYDNKGTWEVTGTTGNKLEVWRDYTKAERESMGEILDARYVIAKTFHVLAHDIASARFFDDIAKHDEWTWHDDDVPPNSQDSTGRWKIHSYADVDWVKVPETIVKGTKVKSYGNLAGKYIKAELWRDIQGLESMHTPSYWREIMTFFKLSKTARNPVVHMNNVMSNMILMDLIDVRATDLVDGYKEYMSQGEDYKEALDSGAFGHNFISQEIRDKVLDPALKEILEQEEVRHTEAGNAVGFSRVLSAIDKAYRLAKKGDEWIIDKYQIEDEIFRMATYMRRRSLGDSAQEAAILARDQFLNYDIRAPWVNAARKTVLPFISYSYRAIPALSASIAHRPWKAAKYITVMYMLNALAYMATGDEDEEDRERASMDESKQGLTWLGFPRMQRMPWKDENQNPGYLDVRRWIPAGDVFDMNQGAVPFLPAWLQMGGPLMIAGEIVANKNTYFDKEIYNDITDTKTEAALKSAAYVIQAMIPSAPWIPGSHYMSQLIEAGMGATNWKGIERNFPQTLASSFGVKLQSVDVESGFTYQAMAIQREFTALRFQLKQLEKQKKQGKIINFRYNLKKKSIMSKVDDLKGLAKDLKVNKSG